MGIIAGKFGKRFADNFFGSLAAGIVKNSACLNTVSQLVNPIYICIVTVDTIAKGNFETTDYSK